MGHKVTLVDVNESPVGQNVDLGALLTLTAQSVGTLASADQLNSNGVACKVVVNISAISGTVPTLTVIIQGKDTVSGLYYPLLTSAALAVGGLTVLEVYPGALSVANLLASVSLPRTWRVSATVGGTGPSVTATIAGQIIV